MKKLYQNTELFFKARGDGSELLDHNLPSPHYYHRYDENYYTFAWILEGYFHTNKGIAYLNDMIARIALTIPIESKYDHSPIYKEAITPLKLEAFQNAKSLKTDFTRQSINRDNTASKDMVWWCIKAQAESLIRQFDGWFNYEILEQWAFNMFVDDVKDKSTLKAKCRSTWMWYEKRDFVIPSKDRGFKMSRSKNMERVNNIRKFQSREKIIESCKKDALLMKNGKISVSAIATDAGVSRPTANKYLLEMGII